MKKVYLAAIILAICLAFIGGSFIYNAKKAESTDFFLNANSEASYRELKKLADAMKKENKRVALSALGKPESGKYNLYTADSIDNLPHVLDKNAINILWIAFISPLQAPEVLRDFDVVVVKHIPGFSHLKAINVRTAYIPDAIEFKQLFKRKKESGKAMFWGDNDGFSLSLYLAGPLKVKVDVFGKGFDGVWPEKDIKGDKPDLNDFKEYDFVLADQSEEDISNEFVNRRILDIIASGAVPFVRYNYGIVKMFGEAVPMYRNEEEFARGFQYFSHSFKELSSRAEAIRQAGDTWSYRTQALKFIELFEIMEKKRR